MAIKECVECGAMVSEDAKACPHCGKKDPTKTITDKIIDKIIDFIVGPLVIFGIIWWVSTK